MTRRALLAAALAAAAAGCGSDTTPTVAIGFRQPSALAVFRGLTRDDPSVRPYLAVANAARNDLTILDAADDTVVQAPVQLRALVLPVAERPALLAAASLGDDDPADSTDGADLLVAVSAGDSVLQVVNTWEAAPAVAVFADPVEGSPAVDLGGDVIALAALPPDPSAPGAARVAAALAGERIALVRWRRAADGKAIELDGAPTVATLGFQPVALAATPDDPAAAGLQTAIYAATLDPLAPGVFGVAEISADLASVRPLDARGPTRLVAAARVRERAPDAHAADATAFDLGGDPAPRVYAVLDESGCGPDRTIACGVAIVDPVKGAIADDWIAAGAPGRMPYRAPLAIPGRPLALAVAPPPAVPPPGAPEGAVYAGAGMRLFAGGLEQTTTGVGAVASDDGNVYFLDLGRFKLATGQSTLRGLGASVGRPVVVETVDGSVAVERRLWLQSAPGVFVPPTATGADDSVGAAATVGRTPGWTRTTPSGSPWTVAFQGTLPQLAGRGAETGPYGDDGVWLAMQTGSGTPRRYSAVVKLWHPALGVRAEPVEGDLVAIRAADVPGCTVPADVPAAAASEYVFELPIVELLAPQPECFPVPAAGCAYPGGAVALGAPAAGSPAEWTACRTALRAAAVVPRLTATIRAGGFAVSSPMGYAGRPVEEPAGSGSWQYDLRYPAVDEDALADTCPLVDWDGILAPPACDAACRAACEDAVLARRARRVHHNFEDCATDPAWTAECLAAWGAPADAAPSSVPAGAPALFGPVVSFRFAPQDVATGGAAAPVRGLSLAIGTTGGDVPMAVLAPGSPYRASSAIAFDRSTVNAAAGYRFLVSYTGDLVFDVSPHVTPVDAVPLR